jgi:hypothetical protein
VQALDGGEVGALVESGFFHGGADQNSAVAARDEINFGRTDYMLEQFTTGRGEAEHLAFDRARGEGVRRDLAGPCSGAIDDFRGVE